MVLSTDLGTDKRTESEERTLDYCPACGRRYFSQTYATPLAGLHAQLSRIQLIPDALTEGMGLNAVARKQTLPEGVRVRVKNKG